MPISLVSLALAFIAGILVGQIFLYLPCSAVIIAAGMLLTGILFTRAGRISLRQVVFAAFIVVLGASLLAASVLRRPADHYSRSRTFEGTRREVAGSIASPLERTGDRVAFLVNLSAIDGAAASGTLRVTVREQQPAFGRGDDVLLVGKLFPPRAYQNPGGFDYRAFLERQGVHAVMSINKAADVRVERRGQGPLRTIEDLRERIRQALLRDTRGDASAVLRAMILGDSSGLTEDLRQRFMNAGVTHILSISGSHLGLVAILCFWVLRNSLFLLPERTYHRITLNLDPKKAAALVSIVPVTFYTLLAGAEVATMRSLIMILAGLATLTLDREHHLLPALALAALISLVPEPQAIFDISFQLSYISVAAILFVVHAGTIADRPADNWRPRLLRSGAMLLAVSAVTMLVTGPLVVLYFNQISLIGLVSNMIVVPFAGAVVVPLGLLTSILSLFTGTIPLAGLVQASADLFVALVTFFAGLPGALVHLPGPGILFLAGYALLVASSAVMIRHRMLTKYRPLDAPGRLPRSIVVTAAVSVTLLLIVIIVPLLRSPRTSVTFLDVGQGDCALLETAGGCRVLIDGGGTRENRFDPGLRVAAPFLWNRGIRTIDLAVLSHPHPDHMNGLASLVRSFPVREVCSSGLDTGLEGYDDFLQAVREKHIPLRKVNAGETIRIKDMVIEVLHPPGYFPQRTRKPYAAENDRSLVLRITAGKGTYLFPGDIHGEAEQALLKSGRELAADVIKVPHHGSRTSSSDAFVRAVRPAAAVMTVAEGNPYRHPAAATIERYEEAGARVYRTDKDGAVIVQEGANGRTFLTGRELMLQRMDGGAAGSWGAMERNNWKRLRIREWGI